MDDLTINLTNQEFKVIKTLIHEFTGLIEDVVENDFSCVKTENDELYLALMDLRDGWESEKIRDAMETWIEIDH